MIFTFISDIMGVSNVWLHFFVTRHKRTNLFFSRRSSTWIDVDEFPCVWPTSFPRLCGSVFLSDCHRCCWSNVISTIYSKCQRCVNFEQARTNGRSTHDRLKCGQMMSPYLHRSQHRDDTTTTTITTVYHHQTDRGTNRHKHTPLSIAGTDSPLTRGTRSVQVLLEQLVVPRSEQFANRQIL